MTDDDFRARAAQLAATHAALAAAVAAANDRLAGLERAADVLRMERDATELARDYWRELTGALVAAVAACVDAPPGAAWGAAWGRLLDAAASARAALACTDITLDGGVDG